MHKMYNLVPCDLGVFDPEPVDGVLGLFIDLLTFFIGVFEAVLMFKELFTEALQSSFFCHRMGGPFDNGASILRTLFSSFSKLNCDIGTSNPVLYGS